MYIAVQLVYSVCLTSHFKCNASKPSKQWKHFWISRMQRNKIYLSFRHTYAGEKMGYPQQVSFIVNQLLLMWLKQGDAQHDRSVLEQPQRFWNKFTISDVLYNNVPKENQMLILKHTLMLKTIHPAVLTCMSFWLRNILLTVEHREMSFSQPKKNRNQTIVNAI